MPKYNVVAEWTMNREFKVEADTLEDAIKSVRYDDKRFPAENGKFVYDSFVVKEDCCHEIKEDLSGKDTDDECYDET